MPFSVYSLQRLHAKKLISLYFFHSFLLSVNPLIQENNQAHTRLNGTLLVMPCSHSLSHLFSEN